MTRSPLLDPTPVADEQADFDSLLPSARLDRRAFVTTLAAAGFALAVQPVQASTAISTDAAGLDTGETTIEVKDGALPLYYARPAKAGAAPVVLVVQEIFGVHEHIRDVCRRLAHQGYLAIAPELFFRQGDPRTVESIGDILQNIVSKVPDAQVMSDLDACADWARANGGAADWLAITGFCWGGRITWLYAAHNPARQGRGRHGMAVCVACPRTTPRATRSTWPLRCTRRCSAFIGGQDQGSSPRTMS